MYSPCHVCDGLNPYASSQAASRITLSEVMVGISAKCPASSQLARHVGVIRCDVIDRLIRHGSDVLTMSCVRLLESVCDE